MECFICLKVHEQSQPESSKTQIIAIIHSNIKIMVSKLILPSECYHCIGSCSTRCNISTIVVSLNFYSVLIQLSQFHSMGCCTAKPGPRPVEAPTTNANTENLKKTGAPVSRPNGYVTEKTPYVSPPSMIQPKQQATSAPKTAPQHNPRSSSISNDYPDMNNYGNTSANYMAAAGRQTTDILHDEDYGYYAANGRNVSMRVDING